MVIFFRGWTPLDFQCRCGGRLRPFSSMILSFLDHFGLADDDPKINPWGGAIAMGHPLASSGVRLMNQLARHFEDNPKVRYGMTTMCIGLGMGGTVIWENSNYKG